MASFTKGVLKQTRFETCALNSLMLITDTKRALEGAEKGLTGQKKILRLKDLFVGVFSQKYDEY